MRGETMSSRHLIEGIQKLASEIFIFREIQLELGLLANQNQPICWYLSSNYQILPKSIRMCLRALKISLIPKG